MLLYVCLFNIKKITSITFNDSPKLNWNTLQWHMIETSGTLIWDVESFNFPLTHPIYHKIQNCWDIEHNISITHSIITHWTVPRDTMFILKVWYFTQSVFIHQWFYWQAENLQSQLQLVLQQNMTIEQARHLDVVI